MEMLLAEGFRFDDMVDVFDAGPQVVANLSEIATVRSARPAVCRVARPTATPGAAYLVVRPMLDRFRVVAAEACIEDDAILIGDISARALDVVEGDPLLSVPLGLPGAADLQRVPAGDAARM